MLSLFDDPDAMWTDDGSPPVVVYTDGACSGNPGPGAWAWIIPGGDSASGYVPATTNQRMELQAVHEVITHFSNRRLHIHTDSRYVVDCFEKNWYPKWIKNHFKRSSRPDSKPLKHPDLWRPIITEYLTGRLTFTWVKGHAGDRGNEAADRLAVETLARRGLT